MRGTASDDVIFTNVEVPHDALVPMEGSDVPGDGVAWSPLGYAAVSLGIAQAARDAAVAYARERRPIGMTGPIAELQTVQHRIAGIELELLKARTLLYATAEWWLANPALRGAQTWRLAAAKLTATNAAICRHRPGAARQRFRRLDRLLTAATLLPRRTHLPRPAAHRGHCADRDRQGGVGVAVAASMVRARGSIASPRRRLKDLRLTHASPVKPGWIAWGREHACMPVLGPRRFSRPLSPSLRRLRVPRVVHADVCTYANTRSNPL